MPKLCITCHDHGNHNAKKLVCVFFHANTLENTWKTDTCEVCGTVAEVANCPHHNQYRHCDHCGELVQFSGDYAGTHWEHMNTKDPRCEDGQFARA